MDNQTLSIILWIVAAILLAVIVMRRRIRKTLR